jgi:carbamoyl-phosphate synthase large subunit
VSKAIGQPLAKLACRIMLGERVADLDLPAKPTCGHVCVKEAVLPFGRFAGADSLLGPEMRSTGEVMGIAADFPTAFAKAQAAAGAKLPNQGTVFVTVADHDKPAAIGIASLLHDLGFRIIATRGTAQALERMGIPATRINKLNEGPNHVVDWIERGAVDLVVNTPVGTGARADGYEIRSAAIARGIPCITTMSGGLAAARAIIAARRGEPEVVSLQELHRPRRVSAAPGGPAPQ